MEVVEPTHPVRTIAKAAKIPCREVAVLIAMAGFPGTGKSTIATRLAEKLGGVVLCKDVVRAVLFPPPALDYSREQDDLAQLSIYLAAKRILDTSVLPVILDGRTFSQAYQLHDLFKAAAAMGESPRIIECFCADEVIRERLERDRVSGNHPAGNRTFAMYLQVKSRAEAIGVPRLVLDTGTMPLEACVATALAYLAAEHESHVTPV